MGRRITARFQTKICTTFYTSNQSTKKISRNLFDFLSDFLFYDILNMNSRTERTTYLISWIFCLLRSFVNVKL